MICRVHDCAVPLVPKEEWSVLSESAKEGRSAHRGFNLCTRHYMRLKRYGHPTRKPETKPRKHRGSESRPAEEVLDDWTQIRDYDKPDISHAADRLGMSVSALDKALYRARKRGDARGSLAPFSNEIAA